MFSVGLCVVITSEITDFKRVLNLAQPRWQWSQQAFEPTWSDCKREKQKSFDLLSKVMHSRRIRIRSVVVDGGNKFRDLQRYWQDIFFSIEFDLGGFNNNSNNNNRDCNNRDLDKIEEFEHWKFLSYFIPLLSIRTYLQLDVCTLSSVNSWWS